MILAGVVAIIIITPTAAKRSVRFNNFLFCHLIVWRGGCFGFRLHSQFVALATGVLAVAPASCQAFCCCTLLSFSARTLTGEHINQDPIG